MLTGTRFRHSRSQSSLIARRMPLGVQSVSACAEIGIQPANPQGALA